MTEPAPERLPRPRGLFRVLRREQRGQALVEFALVFLPLALIILGGIDFGFVFKDFIAVRQGVGDAACEVAVGQFGSNGSCGLTPTPANMQTAKLMCTVHELDGINDESRTRVAIFVGNYAQNQPITICEQYALHSTTPASSVINTKVATSTATEMIERLNPRAPPPQLERRRWTRRRRTGAGPRSAHRDRRHESPFSPERKRCGRTDRRILSGRDPRLHGAHCRPRQRQADEAQLPDRCRLGSLAGASQLSTSPATAPTVAADYAFDSIDQPRGTRRWRAVQTPERYDPEPRPSVTSPAPARLSTSPRPTRRLRRGGERNAAGSHRPDQRQDLPDAAHQLRSRPRDRYDQRLQLGDRRCRSRHRSGAVPSARSVCWTRQPITPCVGTGMSCGQSRVGPSPSTPRPRRGSADALGSGGNSANDLRLPGPGQNPGMSNRG